MMNIETQKALDNLVTGKGFSVIAGPCSVESREQLDELAAMLKEMGVRFLRGGVYKMRTSPHTFRGLGDIALSYMKEVGEKYGLITVTECIDSSKIKMMSEYIDVLLVGTRSMHNYPMLEQLGKISNPIILKRAMSATYQEWLLAAEYIVESGNPKVILCERGIRTFEQHTRNTLDLASVPAMQVLSHFPVIVDPSHSTGKSDYIKPMTWAAAAAGASGVMIEIHNNPEHSLCDAEQAITPTELKDIITPIQQLRDCLYPEENTL